RHTARGKWRKTIATQCKIGGAHTISLLEASASVITAATASGVVANGAGSSPVVIFECTNPGRTTSTRTPDPASASPSPCANASSPAFDDPYTKFERRARSPATDDSTTIVPCP